MKRRSLIPIVAVMFAALTVALESRAQPLVTIDTVTVGDAGNAADTTGYGAVDYEYNIGKYEVTIGQYTAFLNSVARTNTNSHIVNLWNASMATDLNIAGISRSGSGTLASPYSYSVIGSGNRPITYVSWFDAARFANWMHNGATNGASTETGAYTLDGATSGVIFTKNAGATWWIPSEDEWVKAAYYKGGGTAAGYWDYPTQSDSAPGNTIGGATNQANYFTLDYAVTQYAIYSETQNYLTDVGAFSSSASASGTFDQAGNVSEWNDDVNGFSRGLRGGFWDSDNNPLLSAARVGILPTGEFGSIGFRVASVSSNASVLPKILSVSHGSSGFAMTWTPASDVHVQRRLDLTGAAWTTVLSNVTGTSYVDEATPAGRAFYRLTLP